MAGEKLDDLGFVAESDDDGADTLGFIPEESPHVEPDMTKVKQYFEDNLKKSPKEAGGFLEALEAGWQMSVSGLYSRGQMPDITVDAKKADTASQIASMIGQIAGDLPVIIPSAIAGLKIGGVVGGAAGTAVAPGPGTVVGAAGGALVGAGAAGNAAPEAVRQYLMEKYENGEFDNFSDFWARSSSIFWETFKAGAAGGAGGLAGPLAGKAVGPVAGKVAARIADPAADIATMTIVGAGLEGEMPNAEDFANAGLMVGVIAGAVGAAGGTKHVSKKMRDIYAKTGVKPEKVLEDARSNPILQQELLIESNEIPSAYRDANADTPPPFKKPAEPEVTMADVLNEPSPEITPDSLAVRTILEGVEDAPKTTKEGYNLTKAYTDFVDKLTPINEAVKVMADDPKSLSVEQNPYQLARMANDYKAKVKHVVERGTIDFKTLEVTGKGMNEIVSPFKENLREFEAFLISKRAMDYESRGLNAGFDMNAAREVIRQGENKYGKAAKELVDFQRRNLEYIRDAGLISDQSFKAMLKAGESYIPLKRIMEPEQFENVRSKGGALKRVKGVEEGADIKTRSPIMSILENTETFMRLAEKNRAVESFVKMAEKSDAMVIEKVQAKSRPIQVSAEELAKQFKERGIDADAESFNIFRPNQIKLADNEFEVIRNGKREVYRTTKELAEAFNRLDGDPASMGILIKIARGVTTLKRIGITMTPEFVTRNFLRDQMMSAATSKGHVIPFVDVVVAMGDLVKKNDSYYNWLKSGGAQGAFLEINDRYLMKDVFKLEKSTGLIESTWNVIKKPVDAMLAAAHIVELAPRLAEFKKVSGKAKSGGKVFEGGFASREVTLDFQRMGAKLSAFNAITAFTNATIQGADKAARALRDDPAGVGLKAAAYITAPSVLLWWANKDDPRYEAIPRWQKDLYWIIPTDKWEDAGPDDNPEFVPEYLTRVVGDKLQINKGVVYRIPKPHEFGVLFGSLPERVLEKYFKDNPRAFKGFGETIVGMLAPSVVPDVFTPVVEQKFNESLFTGRPLIPFNLEKVAPEYQFTDYTSETAKQLSKLTGHLVGPDATQSPIFIDNYIRQWSGTLGQYAVEIADKGLAEAGVGNQNKPEGTLADTPAVKAFVVRYPGSSAQQIDDFYAREKQIEQRIQTMKLLSKTVGMEDELDSYMEANSGEALATLKGTSRALSNSRKLIRAINANPDIPPKEKRQLIDGQYHHMIQAATAAMAIADQLDENIKSAQGLVGEKGE